MDLMVMLSVALMFNGENSRTCSWRELRSYIVVITYQSCVVMRNLHIHQIAISCSKDWLNWYQTDGIHSHEQKSLSKNDMFWKKETSEKIKNSSYISGNFQKRKIWEIYKKHKILRDLFLTYGNIVIIVVWVSSYNCELNSNHKVLTKIWHHLAIWHILLSSGSKI